MFWLDLIFNIFFATFIPHFASFMMNALQKTRMLFFYETLNMFVASGFKMRSSVPGRKMVDANVTKTGITNNLWGETNKSKSNKMGETGAQSQLG